MYPVLAPRWSILPAQRLRQHNSTEPEKVDPLPLLQNHGERLLHHSWKTGAPLHSSARCHRVRSSCAVACGPGQASRAQRRSMASRFWPVVHHVKVVKLFQAWPTIWTSSWHLSPFPLHSEHLGYGSGAGDALAPFWAQLGLGLGYLWSAALLTWRGHAPIDLRQRS